MASLFDIDKSQQNKKKISRSKHFWTTRLVWDISIIEVSKVFPWPISLEPKYKQVEMGNTSIDIGPGINTQYRYSIL